MKKLIFRYYFLVIAVSIFAFAAPQAVATPTAQEIVDSVIDELDNVTDYTASVDVDYDDSSVSDMTDGSVQWKHSGSAWKSKQVKGSPYNGSYTTDGTDWNIVTSDNSELWIEDASFAPAIRRNWATDMFDMEEILDNESWTKAESTETVNSVECYKVYTTKGSNNYTVWVDTTTMEKVIRVEETDDSDDLRWRLDYSDYSDVESTAQLPATIITKYYVSDVLQSTITYSFSDIDINEGLSDSIFDIWTPE